jgi:hypothetical protein
MPQNRFISPTYHRLRSIGIPFPLRGRRLAGRSPYQGDLHSTGFVEEPRHCSYTPQYQGFTAILFVDALKFFLAASPN